MTAPRYQEVKAAEIPEITDDDGTQVRIVCGSFWGKTGPVDGIAADPIYLDVSVPPGEAKDAAGRDHAPRLRLRVRRRGEVLQRVRPAGGADRRGRVGGHDARRRRRTTARWCCSTAATRWRCRPGEDGIRFLLVSGKPLGGAGGVVRPDRDEHAGAAAAGVRGAGAGDVPEGEGQIGSVTVRLRRVRRMESEVP